MHAQIASSLFFGHSFLSFRKKLKNTWVVILFLFFVTWYISLWISMQLLQIQSTITCHCSYLNSLLECNNNYKSRSLFLPHDGFKNAPLTHDLNYIIVFVPLNWTNIPNCIVELYVTPTRLYMNMSGVFLIITMTYPNNYDWLYILQEL